MNYGWWQLQRNAQDPDSRNFFASFFQKRRLPSLCCRAAQSGLALNPSPLMVAYLRIRGDKTGNTVTIATIEENNHVDETEAGRNRSWHRNQLLRLRRYRLID
jgi:hypothetical protein